MNYTILKQWKTLDGSYYSSTVNKGTYDLAIGEFHSMFKPMQNDTNVAYFRFQLTDEYGSDIAKCSWTRTIVETEEEPTEEVSEEA